MPVFAANTSSRFGSRAQVALHAAARRLAGAGRRRSARDPRRILIVHHLLLGDTLMLTPLLAKLRECHPAAEVVMLLPEAYAPLYATRPYGVTAIGWNPRKPAASGLWRGHSFDLAVIPADNRWSWMALALGARWIVAHGGDRPPYKSWPVDELLPYPDMPAAWGDIVAGLIAGPAPAPYRPAAWPAPEADRFERPSGPYAVLHVGASTLLKQWDPTRWAALAAGLAAKGIAPVWSAGRGEEAVVGRCDPDRRYRSYAGELGLAQIWHLLADSSLLVCPDTGVAHLGRIVGVPTVTLFGPGSATITGAGDFWRNAPYRAVTVDPFPCRDQHTLFKREIAWVQRCERLPPACTHPRCMDAIGIDAVSAAMAELGVGSAGGSAPV